MIKEFIEEKLPEKTTLNFIEKNNAEIFGEEENYSVISYYEINHPKFSSFPIGIIVCDDKDFQLIDNAVPYWHEDTHLPEHKNYMESFLNPIYRSFNKLTKKVLQDFINQRIKFDKEYN